MLAQQPHNIGDFRRDLKDHYAEARRGVPVPVARAHDPGAAVVLDADRLLQALDHLSFHPEVYRQESQIGFWLPELELYGLGENAATAEEDLLEEVREYVAEYLGDLETYLAAPNRRGHYPWVLKAWAADMRGRLADVVLGAAVPA